jgi:hypothetical protein
MRRLLTVLLAVLLPASLPAISRPGVAAEAPPVDLALVLAVDVSASVTDDRYALQRYGFAAAFRSDAVIEAIGSGGRRAIAVTLVEWSGPSSQRQVIGWTIIDGAASGRAFGAALEEAPRAFSDFTSISGALDYSVLVLRTSGLDAQRRVIDVSGDGANNSGRALADAREAALAAGITVNGLAILGNEPGLDDYYRDNVIGGDGAFMLVAQDYAAFSQAILRKLVREIADAPALPYPVATLGW